MSESTTTKTEANLTHKQAQTEGVNAFRAGKQSPPALNGQFIKAACESDNDTARLFVSYRAGWTLAMLADGVSDPDMPSVKALAKLGL